MAGPSFILAIAGPIVSGKDIASQYCSTLLGAKRVSSSSDQYHVLEMFGILNTREHVQALSLFLVDAFGQDTICNSVKRRITDIVEPATAEGVGGTFPVIVDSVRRPSDIACLEGFSPFFLLYIDASPDMRYAWFCKRGKGSGDATLSREEFNRRDEAPTEKALAELKTRASAVINNNGTLQEFEQKIEEALKTLKLL